MRFFRRIFGSLFGGRGPADIVPTRPPAGTTFRLPNQHPRWDAQATLYTVLAIVATYGIFLLVNSIAQDVFERGKQICLFVCVWFVILALFALAVRMRIDWHHELRLTPAELSVHYVASGQRFRTVCVNLAPVRQLTIVRKGKRSLLQAEAPGDSVSLILREQDHELLVRLAHLMADERAYLDPTLPAIRVAVETPGAIVAERVIPPLNTKI